MSTVDKVFTKPIGRVYLASNGQWWITREETAPNPEGRITIVVADGLGRAEVNGTPDVIRRLGEAFIAQADSAEANMVEREHIPITDDMTTSGWSNRRPDPDESDAVFRGLREQQPEGTPRCEFGQEMGTEHQCLGLKYHDGDHTFMSTRAGDPDTITINAAGMPISLKNGDSMVITYEDADGDRRIVNVVVRKAPDLDMIPVTFGVGQAPGESKKDFEKRVGLLPRDRFHKNGIEILVGDTVKFGLVSPGGAHSTITAEVSAFTGTQVVLTDGYRIRKHSIVSMKVLSHRSCPDDGACHHKCAGGACFRVINAEPLSGVFPNDEWPDSIKEQHEEMADGYGE